MGNLVPFAVPIDELAEFERRTTLDEDPVHEAVVHQLETQRVRLFLRQLPQPERTAVSRCYGVDGPECSTKQVARELDVPEHTVRRLVRRGLAELKNRYAELPPAA